MNQFLGSIVLTIFILFSFFFGIRYMAIKEIDTSDIVKFEGRLRAVFTPDESKANKNFPYIIEVLVEEEGLDSLVLDIMYYVPENDDLAYVLSVRPERSDFKVEEKTLRKGIGTERITISFTPKSLFKRRVVTEYLTFYIDAYGESNTDKTYIRKASFIKSWRKQKYRGLFLRRSEFKTF